MNLSHRRILVAGDHDIVRIGVVSFLQRNAQWHVVGEARNGPEALSLARKQKPDIAILDYFLPGLRGLEVACGIATELPHTQVLSFIVHEHSEMLVELWSANADGNVLSARTDRQLVEAVEALSMGHPNMSRETLNKSCLRRY